MSSEKALTLKDFYNLYCSKSEKKGRQPIDYKTFSSVMKDFNLLLRDKIVYKSERVMLPYKMGELYIRKFEVNYDPEKQYAWKVNYKASKEAGTRIYHGEPFGYGWKWNKSPVRLKGKRYYSFKPCRKASRLIADAVKNKNVDYYK